MDGLQLRAHRESIGLTVVDMADVLGVDVETVEAWESGAGVDDEAGAVMGAVAGLSVQLTEAIVADGLIDAGVGDECELTTYREDRAFGEEDPVAAEWCLPAAFHRAATARAAAELQRQYGIAARVVA